jgi:hypothetical protein
MECYSLPSRPSFAETSRTNSPAGSSVYSCSPGGQRNSTYHTPNSPSPSPLRTYQSHQRVDSNALRSIVDQDSPLAHFNEALSTHEILPIAESQISYRIPFSDDEFFDKPRGRSLSTSSSRSDSPTLPLYDLFSTHVEGQRQLADPNDLAGSNRRPCASRFPTQSNLPCYPSLSNAYSSGSDPYTNPPTPPLPIEVQQYHSSLNFSILTAEELSAMPMTRRQRYVSAGGSLPVDLRSEVAAPFEGPDQHLEIQVGFLCSDPNQDGKEVKEKKKGFMAKFRERIGR